jgi:hypothetical protein
MPMRAGILSLFVAVACWTSLCADDPPVSSWKFDAIRLKNGSVLQGLILEQSPLLIRFENVRQKPGRATVVLYTTIAQSEVDSVERLDDAEREQLRARLRELGPEQSEKHKMGRIELETCDWPGEPNGGRRYRSDCFVLTSNSPEAVVRRAAVRLEQIYAAYGRFLPPRVALAKPTEIELIRSPEEFAARLKAEGRSFINTAFYDPARNRILCTGGLQQLGDKLEASRSEFQRIRNELEEREAKLKQLYKGEELTRFLQLIRNTRAEIAKAERLNDGIFDKAAEQLLTILYHEAFHAYLSVFVYPPNQFDAPRWLNEGLAQVFETAIVEAGELRVGHVERTRLNRIKQAVRKGELVPMERLLRSGADQFLAAHAGAKRESDQHYLTAWAVAQYLTFERRLLGSAALDAYCQSPAGGIEPISAFTSFVGQTLPDFERDLQSYLLRLQSDGSVAASDK